MYNGDESTAYLNKAGEFGIFNVTTHHANLAFTLSTITDIATIVVGCTGGNGGKWNGHAVARSLVVACRDGDAFSADWRMELATKVLLDGAASGRLGGVRDILHLHSMAHQATRQ